MKEIDLQKVAKALEGKELFPESNARAKDFLEKAIENPDNQEALEFMGLLIAKKTSYSKEYMNEMFR